MQWYLQIFDFSKIKQCENFSSSAPQNRFIFNNFYLQLTENFHEQKHFLKKRSSCYVYNIFI